MNFSEKGYNANHDYEYEKVESVIELRFLNHLEKYLSDQTEIIVQLPLDTISGIFKADITLKKDNRIIIIECDGEEFHTEEIDRWYDEWRDALILFNKKAETIYRIKGIDIYNNINSLIYLIYFFEQDLFNIGYSEKLPKKTITSINNKKMIDYIFINEKGKEIPNRIVVERKNLKTDFDRFWAKYVLYSLLYPRNKIKQLIEIMKAKHLELNDLISMLNERLPQSEINEIKERLRL